MKNITVTVSGIAGAGKSTIAFLVGRYLRQKGFNVDLNIDVIPEVIESDIQQRVCNLQQTDMHITVNEMQIKRLS
ncbi:MAG: adenylyl-sulfate kinase [Hydrotalea sp. AMD]|uniref:adenylyl-sulfate kinase n=1 Tax=Hydrotalea sp. AMD TaxID=2501297 RepID=UPI001027B6B8|nr:adenylyl-sulfate kinase [Hydrotalea sp. AMD]RWZ87233.1 MAG: adenylyl-sulfate kinase [Hydrotalea sp. AMD]